MRVIRELIPHPPVRTEERTGVPKRAFRPLLGSVTQLFGMLRWQAQARSPTGQLNLRQLASEEGGKAEHAPPSRFVATQPALTIQDQQICRLGRGQSGARPRSRFAVTEPCIDNSTPTPFQLERG